MEEGREFKVQGEPVVGIWERYSSPALWTEGNGGDLDLGEMIVDRG